MLLTDPKAVSSLSPTLKRCRIGVEDPPPTSQPFSHHGIVTPTQRHPGFDSLSPPNPSSPEKCFQNRTWVLYLGQIPPPQLPPRRPRLQSHDRHFGESAAIRRRLEIDRRDGPTKHCANIDDIHGSDSEINFYGAHTPSNPRVRRYGGFC